MKMRILTVMAIASLSVLSCKKNDSKAGVFKGQDVQIAGGKARTFVELDYNGNPENIGISIDNAVLNSLDPTVDMGSFPLPLPSQSSLTPFQYVELDWNPHGHPPPGIYDTAHFDMHFYMMSGAEVEQATDATKLDSNPSADYLPANYVPVPPPVPMMGKHWVDLTSPELLPPSDPNHHPFTQTFIYGSYDGKVSFYEPMITLDYLKKTDEFARSIPQPSKYAKSGYYPTRMEIVKHDNVVDIVLRGLTYHKQS